MLWTVLFTYPPMVGIQMVSARLGCITGRAPGREHQNSVPALGSLRRRRPAARRQHHQHRRRRLRHGRGAPCLLLGGSAHLYTVGFGVLCLGLQVLLRYATYVRYLKWLTLALPVPCRGDIHGARPLGHRSCPRWSTRSSCSTTAPSPRSSRFSARPSARICSFGRPRRKWKIGARSRRGTAAAHCCPMPRRWRAIPAAHSLGHLYRDGFLEPDCVLHQPGARRPLCTWRASSTFRRRPPAAEALRPLGGETTFLLFSLGIIGTGMLALPVLAGSAAYAVSEFRLAIGPDRKVHEALDSTESSPL